ncbi:hypothetical protein [Mechercharimyces sp. CAU 1602]|uniref:hypothetical protein n=1 Tax=Mechercharimyces sp. CAU 1602 TaxID=2973933 RepID=UPI002162ADD1|nr:hypothetical protein [Mechercharimyces sp. CAU 1602]MCS1352458.1 hypothetical protein [Mechercharimyces sp. CAU 1602]
MKSKSIAAKCFLLMLSVLFVTSIHVPTAEAFFDPKISFQCNEGRYLTWSDLSGANYEGVKLDFNQNAEDLTGTSACITNSDGETTCITMDGSDSIIEFDFESDQTYSLRLSDHKVNISGIATLFRR